MKWKPNDSIEFIYFLFRGRCVGLDETCWNDGTDRSHIIPKSRGNIAKDWKNIVLHCPECHGEYHNRGASEENVKRLQARREKYLIMYGRDEYI